MKWCRLAAEQGDAEAQNNMAVCYQRGIGVPENDDDEAARWWRLAAEQGVAEAQSNLSFHYLYYSEQDDNAQAYAWNHLAADQGDLPAIEMRKSLSKGMTPAELKEGQRLAREYAEKYMK